MGLGRTQGTISRPGLFRTERGIVSGVFRRVAGRVDRAIFPAPLGHSRLHGLSHPSKSAECEMQRVLGYLQS